MSEDIIFLDDDLEDGFDPDELDTSGPQPAVDEVDEADIEDFDEGDEGDDDDV